MTPNTPRGKSELLPEPQGRTTLSLQLQISDHSLSQ